MFEALEEAIKEVESPLTGAELTKVLGLLDRLTARVSEAVGDSTTTGPGRRMGPPP